MSKRTVAQYAQNMTAIQQMLTEVAVGRFRWEGLPDRLTSEQLERFITLWAANGLAVGFSEPVGGNMILPAYPSEFDIYWLPRNYTVTGVNYDRIIPAEDCVPFWDNPARCNLIPLMTETTQSLAEIWQVMNINVKQQKNPYAFAGEKSEIESLREAMRRRDQGDEILGVTAKTMEMLETAKRFFPIKPEFLGSQMIEHYLQILNRYLTALGIDNVQVAKRERLTQGETASNNQLIRYYRDSATRMRERAALQYNAMFGANLSVEWVGGDMNEISTVD